MKSREEVFGRFLKYYPVSHALPRGLESILFAKEKMAAPILDLGCGDGIFAMLTFGKKVINMGLDLDPKEIAKARQREVYQETVVGDAQALPFKSDLFKTVVSNSFLEHVPQVDKALKEVCRVLKPGGEFVFTVPNLAERKHWFWAKVFGNFYLKLSDRLMHHFLFYNQKTWEKKLTLAGFKVISCQTYAPQKTVTLLDFLVPFGIFFQLTGKVFGPRTFLAKAFLPYFYHEPIKGFGYFIVAQKTTQVVP